MLKNRKCVTYELNFKLGRQLKHVLSTAMASYKGLVKLGYFTWTGAYRVDRTRDGHTTCFTQVSHADVKVYLKTEDHNIIYSYYYYKRQCTFIHSFIFVY